MVLLESQSSSGDLLVNGGFDLWACFAGYRDLLFCYYLLVLLMLKPLELIWNLASHFEILRYG